MEVNCSKYAICRRKSKLAKSSINPELNILLYADRIKARTISANGSQSDHVTKYQVQDSYVT